MRRTLGLVVAGTALAASFLPLTSASAACVGAWQSATGQCSPCTTLGPAYSNLDNRTGGALPTLDCIQ